MLMLKLEGKYLLMKPVHHDKAMHKYMQVVKVAKQKTARTRKKTEKQFCN